MISFAQFGTVHTDGRADAGLFRIEPTDRIPVPRRPFRKKDEEGARR